ncbi:MAG TPA: polynucleotide adenylyltransferase PcnB [Myxococcaceae bacterium]|jgi:poly(A) polymerase|nr:polynucleotide adenylyltransferase PcnB [Myxococcaceae bacterium]
MSRDPSLTIPYTHQSAAPATSGPPDPSGGAAPLPPPESEIEEAAELTLPVAESEADRVEEVLFDDRLEHEHVPDLPPADERLVEEREPEEPRPFLRIAPPTEAQIDPAKLDADAIKVLFRLRQFGHDAYFVGGCVRDLLLDRAPKDFDIATSAHPHEVKGIFRNCRLIGRRFRLAHVYFRGGKIVEVSTFRANPTEIEDLNGEEAGESNGEVRQNGEDDFLITHDNVFGTAEQDARRRDFTINGLFYDPFAGKVIDYVRGRRDLDERYIRTIGNPEIRMREDPVRILRAVRFASKLGLDIESRTYAAMEAAVEDLPRCAPARLLEETFRLIRGGAASESLRLISALDALRILLSPVHEYLSRTGPDGVERFYAHTRALDRRVREGQPLEDAVLLAAILLPIAQDAPPPDSETQAPTIAGAVEGLLLDLVRNARLPRRIAERCRMILIAQRTLTGQRRRRGSLVSFRRHPLFPQALTVFEIAVEATGEYGEALEAWKAGSAPQMAPDAEALRRRRRRRRRRRGRGMGLGGEPGAPGTAAAEQVSSMDADDADAGDDSADLAEDEPDEGAAPEREA